MRILNTLLSLLVLLIWSTTAKAQYNPTDPPEPGVYFTLTTGCVPSEAGYNLSGSGTHAFGTNINVRVSTTSGYRFICWEDEDGTVVSTTQNFYYEMPPRNVNLTARFVYDPSSPEEPSTPEFKNLSYIDFIINPSEAGYLQDTREGEYEVGSTQNFIVRTNNHYRFVNWTRNGLEVGTSPNLQYTVPVGDHTLVANFLYDPDSPEDPGVPVITRRLTLGSNPEGAAALSGAGEYLEGSSHFIEARANAYYNFVNWTDEEGNTVSESSRFSYTMPERNVTLTANFTYDYNPTNPGEPGIPNPGSGMADNMVLWPRFGMFDDTHVMILCETPGAIIHYTLDGSVPNKESPVYSKPVYVESNLLVRAIAYKDGMEDSPVVSYRVTAYHAAAPVFSMENRLIKITSETPGATIRYTLDFSNPNSESDVYTVPFEPEENCRIKAYASKEGLTDSSISVYIYRRADHVLPAPTFSLNYEGKLVITPAVSGGNTYYTTDGSDPDENSDLYINPIELQGSGVIKAYTTHINYLDSPVAVFTYNFETVEAPSLVPRYRDRTIGIEHPLQYKVIVTIDGLKERYDTPVNIEITPDMTHISVVATDSTELFKSDPVEMDIVFHSAPVLSYNGHTLYYHLADDEADARHAQAYVYLNGDLCQNGLKESSLDISEFATASAVIQSDYAFRSEESILPIDYFNSGKRAGARNGHKISESFGTWGDNLSDYTFLEIIGEVEKDDLEFIGTLPNLTTLHLEPYRFTSEPCDGVLEGSNIETIFSPIYPVGILKGMPRLTTIFWAGNGEMPAGLIAEVGNPNILVWIPRSQSVSANGINIVKYEYPGGTIPTDPEGTGIRGEADQITLQAGYPFNAHMPIDVKKITLTKEFSLPTEIGECAGWESLVLPFTPDSIIHESGDTLVPIIEWTGPEDIGKPFWLYRAIGKGWLATDSIKSGIPYIISMPNNDDYLDGYSLPGRVTFIGSVVTIGTDEAAAKAEEWQDGIEFVGTYMPVVEEGIYSLNVNVAGGRDWLGSAFIDEDVTLPFGAYLRGTGLPRQIPVFGDWAGVSLPTMTTDGLLVETPAPGAIRISSGLDRKVELHTATGITVGTFGIEAGESVTINGLTRGMYIVGGRKVMVR